MRHVFPSDQVYHLWAHQSQSDARNSTGSVFFEGATVYSYRRNWPLGHIHVRASDSARLALLNSDTYSITTSQHQSRASCAVSHLKCISVPCVNAWHLRLVTDWHAENLAHLGKVARDALSKAQRVLSVRAAEWRRDTARSAQDDARVYAGFFGLPVPEFLDTSAWDAAIARAERIEKPDPARDARRFREREQRQAAERAKLQGQFDEYCARVADWNARYAAALAARPPAADPDQVWRNTGRFPQDDDILPREYPPFLHYKLSRKMRRAGFVFPVVTRRHGMYYYDGPVLLRVNGQEIQTSKGARIPLDHAPRLWALIQATRAAGRPYERNGHAEHAGVFKIDRIDVDGTLTAGCHTIAYDELARMARTLGLAE